MHVLDVLENAVEAGARQVSLDITEDLEADWLIISVGDDGPGMDAQTARRALDPFYTTRTTRHVGLGLPLFAAAAERCDGGLALESVPGRGTRVTARFRHSHLDRAPLGRLVDTLLAFVLRGNGETSLKYRHRRGDGLFELDTAAIQTELGEVPVSHPRVREWLAEYISEGEEALSPAGRGGSSPD